MFRFDICDANSSLLLAKMVCLVMFHDPHCYIKYKHITLNMLNCAYLPICLIRIILYGYDHRKELLEPTVQAAKLEHCDWFILYLTFQTL